LPARPPLRRLRPRSASVHALPASRGRAPSGRGRRRRRGCEAPLAAGHRAGSALPDSHRRPRLRTPTHGRVQRRVLKCSFARTASGAEVGDEGDACASPLFESG
jgi:hypothetical protein